MEKDHTYSNVKELCIIILVHWSLRKGLQIYMHDSNEQMEYRCNLYDLENKPLAKRIIKGIQKEIWEHNPWIKQFKTFYEENKHKKTKNISLIIESNPDIPKGRH
eukprot:725524_1